MYFKKKLAAVFAPAFVIAALVSCDGGGDKGETDNVDGDDKSGLPAVEKDSIVENIFYSVPSPIETATLIQRAGVPYNKDYLNDIQNVSKYTTTGDKALNLGVYGSDLSFTSIYDQTQESMLYLKCANNLANGLGISGAFDENTANRLEANKSNKDSLLGIISESFWTADSYLKDNERPGTSSLIIAGGWVEGLYIATKIAAASSNKEIETRIAEQKFTLDNLVKMLKKYDFDETVASMHKELVDLKTVYDQVHVTKSASKSTTDSKTGVTTIGGGNKITITPEQLKTITEKINATRAKIIK
ncbi:MAG: hypothetical protein HYU69_14860 [Bacteroidetes bacterium]|nr:hypothetical protein [Bacteroidota bacterium]